MSRMRQKARKRWGSWRVASDEKLVTSDAADTYAEELDKIPTIQANAEIEGNRVVVYIREVLKRGKQLMSDQAETGGPPSRALGRYW